MNRLFQDYKSGVANFIERFGAVVFLTALLCAFFLTCIPFLFTEKMGSDEALYAWCAQQIAHRPSMIFSALALEFHPPLFPALLALGKIALPFPDDISFRFMSLSLSLLGIFLIYRLGVRLAGRFVGCFCALILAFNYNYLLSATEIMSDSLVFVLFLSRISVKSSLLQHLFVGIIASMIFLAKISSVIIIPFVGIYYLYLFRHEDIRMKLKVLIPVGVTGAFSFGYFLFRALRFSEIVPNSDLLVSGGVRPFSFWYYILNIHNLLIYPFLVPLFLFGIYYLATTQYRYRFLILSHMAILILLISIPPLKYMRYTLIVMPSIMMVAAIGLNELPKRFIKKQRQLVLFKVFSIIIGCVVITAFYPRMVERLSISFSTSTGLAEAGQWIKSNTDPDTLVISQNLRPTRYYSGIEERRFGGWLVLLPLQKVDFEKLLKEFPQRILLQVDLWNESNPSDFSPFWRPEREEEYFRKNGFILVKIVRRKVYSQENLEGAVVPVVKIYERPQGRLNNE